MAGKKETYLFMRFIAILFFTIVLANKAHALGLGMLKVNSNLEQPLDATIDLLLNAGDDVSEIEIVMASRDDFGNFGVDYADYINDIIISFDDSAEQSLVQLQSEEIIKEPFLHFLVRVNWPGGSFLREYTALVDPPLYAAENPRAVTSPRVVGEDQSYTLTNEDVFEQEAQLDAEQLEQTETIQSEPVYTRELDVQERDEVDGGDVYQDEVPSYQNNSVTDLAIEGQGQSGSSSADDARYGPIASGESLSQIAMELQQQFPDLSIYQIMPILLQENPDAFIDNNINGLLEGAVLNISSVRRIREYDIDAGKQFFYDQIAEWASSVGNTSSVDEVAVSSDSYLDTEEEPGIDELFSDTSNNGVDNDSEQEFLVGAGNNYESALSAGDSTDNDAEILALESEIASLEVELQSSSLENQELRERISLLEGQLSDVNRLLSLEDTELSALESTLAEQNDAAQDEFIENDSFNALDQIDDSVQDETDLNADAGLDQEQSDILAEVDDEVLSDAGSALETLDDELDGSLIGDDESVLDDGVIELVDESVEEGGDITAEATTPVRTVSINKSESFFDKAKAFVVDSAGWQLLAGIGAVILAFVGLLFYRRRRADEEFEVSMMTIESHQTADPDTKTSLNNTTQSSVSIASKDAVSNSVSQLSGISDEVTIDQPTIEGETKETSFLTVYSDSDAVVQSDEVDPVAEADVYIAYGRDEQAEEVLISGIDSFPERSDIKHKLLGLYHKNENTEEFERIAETMYADVDNVDSAIWSDICKMGLELNPDNPIFTATTTTSVATSTSAADIMADVEEDVEDQDDESFLTEANISSQDEVEVSIDPDDLDFGDSSLSDAVEDSSLIAEVSSGEVDDNEFTQDDIELSLIEADDEIKFENLVDDNNDNDEQTDVSDELSATEFSDSAGGEEREEQDIIEFESLELEDIEDIDQNNENSFDEITDAEISGLEFEDDYDEAETQFELAKVFSDLGDNEGAKRILHEIINDRHNKKELIEKASGLLETIDS